MNNREFYLEHDGLKIHCKLDYPDAMRSEGDKGPLLVLAHGLTGHTEQRHIVGVAEYVRNLGFAVLRMDLYGHGLSDGEFRDHTIWKWVEQLQAVVKYASALPFVTDLYLAGHSQGGLTTMIVGAMQKDRLKAIMPLAPAIVLHEGAKSGDMLGEKFDPDNIPDEFIWRGDKIICGEYFRTAQLLPVADAIRRFDKPVLIAHSDTDDLVPVKYAYDAAAAYKDCTLKIVCNDTHCYDSHLDEVCDAIGAFLEKIR